MPQCERCLQDTRILTGSWFDQSMICPNCDEAELNHQDIEIAKAAERLAVIGGDLNFPGIGKPQDL